MMFSISKSFMATAVGLAEDAGLLSVDEPILSFFPASGSKRISEAAGGVLVRHLLSMSTGHEIDTFPVMRSLPDADWVRTFFEVPFVYPPGTHFLYNTGASYVLSAALAARTGQSLVDFLRPRLFEPLGIETPPWATSPTGVALGGTGLRATTEDIAKLGQLYLQRGVWNGQQVVSEEWVDKATSVQIANHSVAPDWASGYGFQFWRSRHDSYRADGAFAQFSFVLPQLDTVIAITAGLKENWRIPDLVWNHLLPGIEPEGRSVPTADSDDGLAARIRRLEIAAPPLRGVTVENLPTGTWALPFNTLGLVAAALQVSEDLTTLTLTDGNGGTHQVTGASDQWIAGDTTLWHDAELVSTPTATRAGWTESGAFELHEQCLETVFCRIWRFERTGEHFTVLTIELTVVGAIERTESVELTAQ
jgi:hypothetical protein